MKSDRRPGQSPPMFLASVTSLAEAEVARAGGADVIDCKDPASGALGALADETVREVRSGLPRGVTVSATVGDFPSDPDVIVAAAEAMAATGVDYVKIGFPPDGDPKAAIRRVGAATLGRARPVGVLFADRDPDLALIGLMARAGFAGAMLDTAGKDAGSLPRVLPLYRIALFVREARRHRMFAGLAGALRLPDIATLAPVAADILGFRGALCRGQSRTGPIEARAVAGVRRAIDRAAGARPQVSSRETLGA